MESTSWTSHYEAANEVASTDELDFSYPRAVSPVELRADVKRAIYCCEMAEWMIAAAAFTLALCTAIVPPYGRYSRDVIFGIRFPMVNAKLAWIVMESPNVAMAAWCFAWSNAACRNSPANIILLCLFVGHYVNRSFVFPLRMRGGRSMPLLVTAAAFVFCTLNGYLQCSHLLYAKPYPNSWLCDPRFVLGVGIFALGFWINCDSDAIVRQLRGPKESDYKIPRGGLFEYVSGANFFGECLEWCGFALAGWSLPALSFALYTIANLAPRAYRHHQWYLDKFEDYPSSRKALVPFVW